MVLDKIVNENDIKKLTEDEIQLLRKEIREFLISSISNTGGHLASNLGTVELTMALHLSFQLPEDKIIWDVGHQSYTHKILTGRKEGFKTLRQYGGMSGFPKTGESPCDSFNTGHSSTSISAGIGMAKARDLKGENYSVISVIGDGALTGGLAFEALNNASQLKSNFIIVLNDNNMSISKNVGGMNNYLSNFRTGNRYRDLKNGVMNHLNSVPFCGKRMVKAIRNAKSGIKQLFVPGMLFEEMGVMYLGPVDGRNIAEMRKLFQEAKRVDGPVLVHVISHKGDGYEPAEKYPSRFHGTDPFEIENGLPKHEKQSETYTDIFGSAITRLGEKYDNLVTITAAMEDGTGLRKFHEAFPERFFDVGIAEQHAVTFAAGLAISGMIPVVAVYSSFLQRAYDQIIHDVCIQNLPVIFAIDRAGLVGSDGETHQGIYDISYLSTIPNLIVMAPSNRYELEAMLEFAINCKRPVAIRYPKGEAVVCDSKQLSLIEFGKPECLVKGNDLAIVALGSTVEDALKAGEELKKTGKSASVYNARFASMIDKNWINDLCKEYTYIITVEENIKSGGFGEHFTQLLHEAGYRQRLLNISLPDSYIEHGSISILKEKYGIDAKGIYQRIVEGLK